MITDRKIKMFARWTGSFTSSPRKKKRRNRLRPGKND